MIEKFSDVKDIPIAKFIDSPLGKILNGRTFESSIISFDKPLAIIYENYKNCPIENGEWSGERGDSKWKPEREYVPLKANPEGKTWGEILDKYGIDGIKFKDGEPNFSEISKGNVEIEPFTDSRSDNFDKADIELAKQRGCTPKEVKQWRKENGYTWHECRDMKSMQKVPSIVHNNISHSGGISEVKKGG